MNTTMRRAMVAVLAAVGVAAVLTACTGGTDAVDQTAGGDFRYTDATQRGTVIPAADRQKPGDVSGPLLSGGTYHLTADAGQVVVVNLWGSWCPPCRVETPEFQQVYEQTRATGVQFVGFAVKETSEGDTKQFVAVNDITYPIVYDPLTKVALQLGRIPTAGLPLTAVVDKQGRVAAVYVGSVQPSQLKPVLAQLTAES